MRKPMTITGEENIIGRNVVCIDDMGDTLGTLCKQGDLVMKLGASSFRGFLTHPVLSGNALEKLYNSKITELVVSDTIVSVYGKQKQYEDMLKKEAIEMVRIANAGSLGMFDTEISEIYPMDIERCLLDVKARRPKFTIVTFAIK